MSRTPASYSMPVVRGSTWEDVFTYVDDAKVPVDLTGYSGRMQVRTLEGQYGTSTDATLVMELTTDNGRLYWDTAAAGVLRLRVEAADTVLLNPSNQRRARLAYSIEVFLPESSGTAEYVIPLVQGYVAVQGEVTR